MTDDQQWQAPQSATPPPPPAFGSPVPPPMPPAAPAQLPVGGAVPPVWAPPPKPGLIPLRVMTLGTILGASFQTLRRNPGATLVPALILSLAVALIQSLTSAGFLTKYFGALSDYSNPSSTAPAGLTPAISSSFLGLFVTSLGAGILSLIITAIVQGIVTLQVASSTLGTRLRLGGLWRRMRGRRGALVGWALLSGLVSVLAVGIIGGLLVLLGSTGTAGVVVALLLGFLLGAGLFVVSVWLWVKLGFVPAIIVLERTSIRRSMARSWALTRGGFWRLFGIRLLVAVMIGVASSIITTPISLLFSLGTGVFAPTGSTTAAESNTFLVSLIVTQAVTAVITAVGLVISTATVSLLYLDQRMRLEGLDLDLARYVEHRQAGQQDLRDPYAAPERV